MAWSYKDYTDNEATKKAKAERDKIASQKPGEFTYNDYVESDTVKAAYDALNQQMANKPGAYQSSWQQNIDDTLNKILNREKFSYDLNGDMLYQQYKDQYVNQGKMAMMDTMGQAAALTGGYGNSYAQSVGQQTYQGYLQQLNDKIPELYQLALDQYNREGEDLYNQYALFADRENTDYGRYRDTVADYNDRLNYLTDVYYNESDRDYNRYTDKLNFEYGVHRDTVADWQNALNRADNAYYTERDFGYNLYNDNRNMSYTDYRNTIADQQWQKEFDEAQRQFNAQMAKSSRSGGGGSNSSGSSVSSLVKGLKAAQAKGNDSLYSYMVNNLDGYDANAVLAALDEAGIPRNFVDDYERTKVLANLNGQGTTGNFKYKDKWYNDYVNTYENLLK